MKSLGNQKWRLLLLLTAYVVLLAHAFVPHHHHSDFTAFVNTKSCPHHGHHDHSPLDHPEPIQSGDCETLKNILLTDDDADNTCVSALVATLYPEIFAYSALPPTAEMAVDTGTRLRWGLDSLPDSFTENISRRGPPALA